MKIKIEVTQVDLDNLVSTNSRQLTHREHVTLNRITAQMKKKLRPLPELPEFFGTTAMDVRGMTYVCAPVGGTSSKWVDARGVRSSTTWVRSQPGLIVTRVGDGMPSKTCS